MKNIVTHYAGSHAYGTNTPESDTDIRGIFVADREHICTPFFPFREKVGEGEDEKYYELCNYINLYTQGNPNILESLWVDESDIICSTQEYNLLRSHRKELLSKKVAFTFTGYAVSQLKRIKGHNKWINNPQPVEPPKHKDFIKMVQNFTECRIMPNEFNLDNYYDCGLVHYSSDIYGIVDDDSLPKVHDKNGEFNISIKQSEQNRTKTPPLVIIKYCKEEYLKAKDNHHNYWQWKNNRNEKRSLLEEQYGYDCYLDSETEFLTDSGFKKYDDIDQHDRLATVNPHSKNLEFQFYSERVKKEYSGEIYFGETQDTSFAVTGNHRMFVSDTHRRKENNFSTKYVEEESDWYYSSLDELVNSNKSYYHILTGCNGINNKGCERIEHNDRLVIMGAYISDGCLLKHKNGSLKGVSISQLEGNRLCKHIENISNWKVCKTQHIRAGRYENTYNIYDKDLASWLLTHCNQYSKTKHLPYFIGELSKEQCSLLLDVMIAGDGTNRKYSDIYYTSSKRLSDDVQMLSILAGRVSKKWEYIGKYACDQIYISKKQPVQIFNTNVHLEKKEVKNGYIVCFTVPNENLITRRNGKIAIQGNTKHAHHLVRLLRMGEEILSTGEVVVKRPDAKELLDIRNGKMSYEDIVSYAEEKDAYIREVLYKQTELPKKPNLKLASKIIMEVQDMVWDD